MIAELFVRFMGPGYNCTNCGKNRETTRYILAVGDIAQQEAYLCNKCCENGCSVKFTISKSPVDTHLERRKRVKLSRKLEESLASDIGGRRQPGSGNKDAKGDVRVLDRWRLEHKYTDSYTQFILRVQDLAEIVRQATSAVEWPGLVITFRRLARRFVVIPYEIFLDIVENGYESVNNRRPEK